jgi:hypothetical protein
MLLEVGHSKKQRKADMKTEHNFFLSLKRIKIDG